MRQHDRRLPDGIDELLPPAAWHLVFTAYRGSYGRAIALGRRYDAIGSAFGRARPSTGFDVDLRRLPAWDVRKSEA
jgi:ATP phosphoribosyltransferase regulatory subunit